MSKIYRHCFLRFTQQGLDLVRVLCFFFVFVFFEAQMWLILLHGTVCGKQKDQVGLTVVVPIFQVFAKSSVCFLQMYYFVTFTTDLFLFKCRLILDNMPPISFRHLQLYIENLIILKANIFYSIFNQIRRLFCEFFFFRVFRIWKRVISPDRFITVLNRVVVHRAWQQCMKMCMLKMCTCFHWNIIKYI